MWIPNQQKDLFHQQPSSVHIQCRNAYKDSIRAVQEFKYWDVVFGVFSDFVPGAMRHNVALVVFMHSVSVLAPAWR